MDEVQTAIEEKAVRKELELRPSALQDSEDGGQMGCGSGQEKSTK